MSDVSNNESTNPTDAPSGQFKTLWKFIGCTGLLLLFLFGPVLMMIFSNFVHVAGLTVAGLLISFLLARLFGRKMSDRGVILPEMLLFAGLITLGVLLPHVPWLPCPSWVKRNVVKRSDYRMMERIFEKPLPLSFRITQTRYPGYDLVFNGPDGPLPAGYEVIVDAKDLSRLTQGLNMEERKSEQGQWPGRSYDTLFLMRDLQNEMAEQYCDGKLEDRVLQDSLNVFTLKKIGDTNWISIDERTSPSLKVYISTRVPYMRNPS